MPTVNETNIFTFTNEQFFIMAGMLRLNEIIGFKDPYRGWLVAEIKERSFQVINELAAKGWITKNEAGEWEVDDLIGVCVAACSSNLALKAYKKRASDNEVYEGYLYLTPRLVVERTEEMEDGVPVVSLSPISDAVLIQDVLTRFYPALSEEMEREITMFQDIVIPGLSWEQWRELNVEERSEKFCEAAAEELPEGVEEWAIRPDSAEILAWFERCERIDGIGHFETCGFAYTDGMLIGITNKEAGVTFFPYSKRFVEQFVQQTIAIALGGKLNG